jgi:hypothetical protein
LWVAVLVGAAIVLVLAVTGGNSGRSAFDGRIDRGVSALLAGIPQYGNSLGSSRAPVTLQVFGDLECLTVKNWVVRLLPAIIAQFVRPGLVRVEYRSFKTDTHDPRVFVGQQAAALAAGSQNKMWNFIETFYHEQGREYTPYVTETYLDGIASQVPDLNIGQWHRDRGISRLSDQPVADDRTGRALGFHDTPAFAIGRTGGRLKDFAGRYIVFKFSGFTMMRHPVSLIDTQDLKRAVEELLNQKRK